jgi:hypothetical protein
MASYINNIAQNAQIAPVLPFTPDWQFLSSAQQTLTNMQTEAFSSFADKYSTYLKQDLIRQDNIAFRDSFLKEADSKIKMVSGTDLTDPRNLQSANSIFNSLTDNKLYLADILQSQAVKKGLQTANNFATSPDPAARALYNPYSENLLKYAQLDFATASPDQAVNMSTPTYVPGVDFRALSKRVLDDYGMNVEFDEQSGSYLYTYQNGQVVEGHMKEAIQRELLKDPAVRNYASTRVESDFRDSYETLASTGLTKEEAQLRVAQNVVSSAALTGYDQAQIDNIRSYAENEVAIREHEKKIAISPYTPGSAEEADYNKALQKRQQLSAAKDAGEQYLSFTNSNSPSALIQRAKMVLMNNNLEQEFSQQAASFAMKNAKIKINADDLAKSESKGAGKNLAPDYADNIDIGAPGAEIRETTNWAKEDADTLVRLSREVTEIRKDAIKTASLMDVPEIRALTQDVDFDSLTPEQVIDLYNKVDTAFNNSETAKGLEEAQLYLNDKDKINDSFAGYYNYLNSKRNNNKVIQQQLIKAGVKGAEYLFDENGRMRSEEEFEKITKTTVAPMQMESEYGKYSPSMYESFNPYGDEKLISTTGAANVYKSLVDKFTEVYNKEIRKANSPITSISAKANKLEEGFSYPRVSFLYDQNQPESAARQLSENLYQNLNNANPESITIGDNTGEDLPGDDLARSLIKGPLRKILLESIASKGENRIQYEISFQDAALGKADLAAYNIKFVDTAKLKEFLVMDSLSDAEKQMVQKLMVEGMTIIMQDKNMVSKPTALNKADNATSIAFRANGNRLDEDIPGYGRFSAIPLSGSSDLVRISMTINGQTIISEQPLSMLQDIRRDWRNKAFAQKRQQRQSSQQ